MVSTLLVPGYVELIEIRELAAPIADLDRTIPYGLLEFHLHFYMHDLPMTSVRHAEDALAAAQAAGLSNARIGNRHVLSRVYWRLGTTLSSVGEEQQKNQATG